MPHTFNHDNKLSHVEVLKLAKSFGFTHIGAFYAHLEQVEAERKKKRVPAKVAKREAACKSLNDELAPKLAMRRNDVFNGRCSTDQLADIKLSPVNKTPFAENWGKVHSRIVDKCLIYDSGKKKLHVGDWQVPFKTRLRKAVSDTFTQDVTLTKLSKPVISPLTNANNTATAKEWHDRNKPNAARSNSPQRSSGLVARVDVDPGTDRSGLVNSAELVSGGDYKRYFGR